MTSKKSNYVFQLAGTLTTAGTTVAITNDLELNQVVEFTNASIVLRNRNATIIERAKGDASGGTLTLTKRGLTQGDTEVEDPALVKEWRDGTRVYVTILAPQIVDAQGNNVLTGDNTFEGAVEFDKSVRIPIYADDTARDAGIPTPTNGMIIYNQDTGVNQQYIGGAWSDISTGPVTPNASETVAGKVQEATQTEMNNATADGSQARLYANPSKLPTAIASYINNNSTVQNALTQEIQTIITAEGVENLTDKDTYLLGEDVTAGDSLFREDMVTFASATTVQNIGDVSGNTRVSIPVFGSGTASNTLKLALRKFVSPGVDLGVRIETDNAGEPSGTLIDPNATATVLESGLTTSLVDTTVTMAGTSQNNAHGVTLDNTQVSQVGYKGVKITLTQQVSVVTVVKDSDCTATHAYIYDTNGVELAKTTFSTNTATFNFGGVVDGGTYYVLAGSEGSSYTSVRQTGSTSFPYVSNRINYVGGIAPVVLSPLTEAHNVALNTTFNTTNARGFRINANKTLELGIVTKNSSCTATRAILKDVSGNTLTTVSFSGDTADFGGYRLIQGTNYRIEADANGATYASRQGDFATQNRTNINFVNGSQTGSNNPSYWNIVSVQTAEVIDLQDDNNLHNITDITTSDTILIPQGQKAHIVLYPGVYGSETINGTNYFGVGYRAIDTTTRRAKTFDGADWSAGQATRFYYTTSNLFLPQLLSKTDATYSYKLPVDFPRIATESKTAGQNCITIWKGLADLFSGLTQDADYYLADTPGTISATAGTNKFSIGQSINSSMLSIPERRASFSMIITRDMTTASNVVSYTHTLFQKPKSIEIYSVSSTNLRGYYTLEDNFNRCLYSDTSIIQTSSTFSIVNHTSTTASVNGVISNVTSTGFDITWTRVAAPSGTATFILILNG